MDPDRESTLLCQLCRGRTDREDMDYCPVCCQPMCRRCTDNHTCARDIEPAKPTAGVAVIIPTRSWANNPMLNETIESVTRQTVQPLEEYVMESPTLNLWERINKAVESTAAAAFIVLSDDDHLHPFFVEKTVRAMHKESADIVYTDLRYFGDHPEQDVRAAEWNLRNLQQTTVPWFTSLCSVKAWRYS